MVQTLVASGLGQPGLPETLTSQIVTFNVNVVLSSNINQSELDNAVWMTYSEKEDSAGLDM